MAQTLSEQGFRIVPLVGKGGPLVAGFGKKNPHFSCDPELFDEPGTNVGILCGPCPALGEDYLVCLDFDGPYEQFLGDFLELLPPTLTSHSSRHRFYRVPAARAPELGQWVDALHTKIDTAAALDLKWSGGYACERGDWDPGTDLSRAAESVATLPEVVLEMLIQANRGTAAKSAPSVQSERVVDPLCVPDVTTWDYLVNGFVKMWPDSNRRVVCFALGGVMARGNWTDELCEMFLEEILDKVGCDAKATADGMTCMALSLEKAPDEPGVFRFTRLVETLAPKSAAISNGFPATVFARMFVEKFVVAMQTVPVVVTPVASTKYLQASIHAVSDDAKPDLSQEAYKDWEVRLKCNKKEPVSCSYNVVHTFGMHPAWKGVFGWDTLAEKVVILRAGPMNTGTDRVGEFWCPDDNGTILIQSWFDVAVASMQKVTIQDGVRAAARWNSFHPVQQYLQNLPEWDGVDRNLCTYFRAEETEYHRAVCATWLRTAVARAMNPGVHVKDMIVLEGPQNAGKSTALRTLCAKEEWFLIVRADVKSKDFMSDLRGKWIGEIAEFDRLTTNKESADLKDIIASPVDTYRKAYGADAKAHPRQMVFAGSTNVDDYLRDATGNVRYRPVRCGARIDFEGIARDRDQIWSQAAREFFAGQSLWLSAEHAKLAEAEAFDRLEHDEWEHSVQTHLEELLFHNEGRGFSISDAMAVIPGAIPLAQTNPQHYRRMAKVLRKLGLNNGGRAGPGGAGGTRLWRR